MLRSEDASELDRYLRALQNRNRRCISYYLSETSVADIEELAQQITTEKSGSDQTTTVVENQEFVQTKLLQQPLSESAIRLNHLAGGIASADEFVEWRGTGRDTANRHRKWSALLIR